MEVKLKNEYQKKLNLADKVARKQIKDEHQLKWKEFCETHKVEIEAFFVSKVTNERSYTAYCAVRDFAN